jgi:hypothetical protein
MSDLSLLAWRMAAIGAGLASLTFFAIALIQAARIVRLRRALAEAEDKVDALEAALGANATFLKVHHHG